jgi:V8-like Glu-specific endopeptidase
MNRLISNAARLAATLAVAATVFAHDPGGRNEGVSTTRKAAVEADTPERLRAIRPLPMPILKKEDLERRMSAGDAEEGVEFGFAPAVLPVAGVPQRANVHEPPFQSAGKLFFEVSPGRESSCTAQFVSDLNVILTAAHCVRDGRTGQWYTNFRFYRAYADGGGQAVTTRCAGVKAEWLNGPNFAYDYAFLRTNESSNGGSMGLRGPVFPASFTAIGYPANIDHSRFMLRVAGSFAGSRNGIMAMAGNPMREGSSGGAWIDDLSTTGAGNYAISVNSFGVDTEPGIVYGPVFTDETADLYLYVRNDCR